MVASRRIVEIGGRRDAAAEAQRISTDEGQRIGLFPPFEHEIGYCWISRMNRLPEAALLSAMADDETAPSRSKVRLYENGLPLGPAHALHGRVRESGRGAFSHWRQTLLFSTSDNSDPNLNGRRYEIGLGGDRDHGDDPGVPGVDAERNAPSIATTTTRFAGPEPTRGALPREREIVEKSGRFDAEFYRRSYGDSIPDESSPLDHFLTLGHDQGLLASAHFDPIVYKLSHPIRRHVNALVDSILMGDEAGYRDIAALFRDVDLDVETMPLSIRYARALNAEWPANAHVIAENPVRSVRMPWRGFEYELRNPGPEIILRRFAENRPFCFARLPHGFWDDFCAVRKLARRLGNDPRTRSLNEREVFAIAIRLLGRKWLLDGSTCVEGFLSEVEADLLQNPKDEDFWTALSIKGLPTYDDGLFGYNEEDVKDRLELLSEFFQPSDRLFDANLWKRWALTGDIGRLVEAARSHGVVLVAPSRLRSLGRKWGLSQFRHIAIPPNHSYLLRPVMLSALGCAIEAALAESRKAKPIVFFQCGGELSYWLMRRLRPRHPEVFYIDLGEVLDLWCWRPERNWFLRIYGDVIRAVNPFILTAPDDDASPAESSAISLGSLDDVTEILRRDYLDSGLMAAPSGKPILTIAGPFKTQGANGWQAALPKELEPLTDNDDMPRRSPFVLLEDGSSLGKGHDFHAEIIAEGRGRYSFWKGTLYFSTSDNSDPNRNSRKYEVGRIEL